MITKKDQTKRKKINFSIKTDLQFRLIFRIFIIILIAVLVSGTIFWIGSHRKTKATYYQFHVQLRNFKDLILPLGIIGTITGLLVAVILALFYPLSLAGPLYRIEKCLERVANGDLSDHSINLRARDELKDLAYQLNNLLDKMRERVKLLKEKNKSMEKLYSEMTDALENSDIELIKETMNGINEEMTEIRDILNAFKL